MNGKSTTASNFSLFGVPNTGALAAFSFPRVAFDLFAATLQRRHRAGRAVRFEQRHREHWWHDDTFVHRPAGGTARRLCAEPGDRHHAVGARGHQRRLLQSRNRRPLQRRASVEPPGGRDHRAASRVHGAATIGAHGRPHAGHHVQRPRRTTEQQLVPRARHRAGHSRRRAHPPLRRSTNPENPPCSRSSRDG